MPRKDRGLVRTSEREKREDSFGRVLGESDPSSARNDRRELTVTHLQQYERSPDEKVSAEAVNAIGRSAQARPEASETAIKYLLGLLKSRRGEFSSA